MSARDFHAQQSQNRLKTWLLLGSFACLFAVMGSVVDLYWGTGAIDFGVKLPVGPGVIIALAIALVSSGVSYFWGGQLALSALNARPVNSEDPQEAVFENVAQEMALAAGLPMPKLYMLPDDDLNAFAAGRSPEHAVLAVTDGLLDALTREELQAVVAHEMGHIRNLDVRTMTVVAALLSAVLLFSEWFMQPPRHSSRSSNDKDGGNNIAFAVLLVVVGLVMRVLARMIAMAISRTREFDADAAAAELTRNPEGLASALRKIGASHAPTQRAVESMAHLFVMDPRASSLDAREDTLSNLFATHPPINRRIERLEAMAGRVTRKKAADAEVG